MIKSITILVYVLTILYTFEKVENKDGNIYLINGEINYL